MNRLSSGQWALVALGVLTFMVFLSGVIWGDPNRHDKPTRDASIDYNNGRAAGSALRARGVTPSVETCTAMGSGDRFLGGCLYG
jgi:hypothetical protein